MAVTINPETGEVTVPEGMSLTFFFGDEIQVMWQEGKMTFYCGGVAVLSMEGGKIGFREAGAVACPESTPGANIVNHESWEAAGQGNDAVTWSPEMSSVIYAFLDDYNAVKTALINQGLLKLPT